MGEPKPVLRRVQYAALLLAVLLGPGGVAAQPAPERWVEEFWNPKPMPDDLVLPLPCGGAMAFRPVPTPVSQGPMADRQATLGQPDEETNYSEYLHQAFLLGSFRGTADIPPRYYLAKYEVTRDQYAAVTAETCPTPSLAGRAPQADIAWHEAIAFTLRLSGWIARNARDALPKQEDALGYLRLPTEEEWEFAMRGGTAVAEADFIARLPPMPEGIQRHAWFQGSRSAAGRARPVGMLEPNPLGLFDMLGNVAEWVLEPYRLNKVGRPHGLVGGMVARGGDFQTAESQLRSSLRVEMPPLAANGEPLRLRSIGLRPVLATVATTSDQRPAALRAEFDRAAQSRSSATEDPARLLDLLGREATDPALRQGIERVGAALRTETRARREQESQAIRSQIAAVAQIGRQIVLADAYRGVLTAMGRVQGDQLRWQQEMAEAQGRLAQAAGAAVKATLGEHAAKTRQNAALTARIGEVMQREAAAQGERIDQLLAAYLRTVLAVGRSTEGGRIGEEAPVVAQEFEAENAPRLPELARLAARHMQAVAAGNPPTRERVLADLVPPAAPAGGGGTRR